MEQFFLENMGSSPQSEAAASAHSTGPEAVEGLDSDLHSTGEISSFLNLSESLQHQTSDDSGISISSKSQSCELQTENSVYFSTLSSKIDEIGKKAQDLIEKINENRAVDQEILNNFQEKLMKKVSEVCQNVREQMFSRYEENSRVMEMSLMELSEVLDRSTQLNTELQNASLTLAAISRGLHQAPAQ
ncbi:synaptonemal complex central element protein 2 [Scleropages formosus]|uniref:synaptonemal complex central element protein 2 n=1 Tax=Scleropages formosus TaxID=113540 RepID=UPI0008789A53|nr:synaptonemal complex central element protein 2 [Scleropages formosus]